MSQNNDKIQSLEVRLLEARIEALEKTHTKYEKLLEKLAESINLLTNKVIALETNEDNVVKQLDMLIDGSKTQNKLLLAIATSMIGALATFIIKYLLGAG